MKISKKKLLMTCIICVVVMAAVTAMGCKKGNKDSGGSSGTANTKTDAKADTKIKAAMDALVIYNADNIRENISLPDADSKQGTTIEWSADKEGIIDTKPSGKMPAGVIHRQDQDVKVKLTAKVSLGDVSQTKDFDLTIKAKPGKIVTTDYLFATFKHDAGPAGQQIWFSTSNDGNNWKDINNDKAVLSVAAATEGDKGVRDPYLLRSPDGDKFYLIATDLCIGDGVKGSGTHTWDSSQNITESSKYLRIWESYDLVNWSEPWLLKVGISTSTFTWAPEAIWDEESGQYMLYWSAGGTKDTKTGDQKPDNRTWYCMTRDFRTFTKPETYTSSVNGKGMIDLDIIYTGNNTYYRISSSTPDIMLERSKNGLFGDWEKVGSLQDFGFNYVAAVAPPDDRVGVTIVEGPEIFKYNDDDALKGADGKPVDTWGILVDNYGGVGYFPIVTTDLSSTVKFGEAGSVWSKPSYDFDSPKRHGTILPITADEYSAIMQKWGGGASGK